MHLSRCAPTLPDARLFGTLRLHASGESQTPDIGHAPKFDQRRSRLKSHVTESVGIGTTEPGGLERGASAAGSERVDESIRAAHEGEEEETVTLLISSSSGYEDSETFTVRGKKAANAFARCAMALCLRRHNRRTRDGE
jgi:hypothetical protein